MDLEILRKEYHKVLKEITAVAGTLENPSIKTQERVKLREEFKVQFSRAIDLEAQLFDLMSLSFRHT